MLYWKIFCSVILSLTPATWCLIVLPLIVGILLVLKERGSVSALGRDSVWKTLGRKWGAVGFAILAVALAAYMADVLVGYYKPQYNQAFYEALRQQTSKIGTSNVRKALVRKAATRMEEGLLRDMANSYAASIAPEQRLNFLHSFLGSNLNDGIIQWGDLLASENSQTNGIPKFSLTTNLPLDQSQRKLYKDQNWTLFWPSLREEQWKYISKQLFATQNHESMVEILANLVTELNVNEGVRLAREMINTQYGGSRNLSMRIANEAGVPELLVLFDVLIIGISWLRGIVWLALWFIVGLVIVLQASKMKSSSRLFPVYR
jgi:hypothetical protein